MAGNGVTREKALRQFNQTRCGERFPRFMRAAGTGAGGKGITVEEYRRTYHGTFRAISNPIGRRDLAAYEALGLVESDGAGAYSPTDRGERYMEALREDPMRPPGSILDIVLTAPL